MNMRERVSQLAGLSGKEGSLIRDDEVSNVSGGKFKVVGVRIHLATCNEIDKIMNPILPIRLACFVSK